MARIAGIDLPRNKRMEIALTYIFGIGRKTSNDILAKADVSPDKKSDDIDEVEVRRIRDVLEADYQVEGDLRRERNMNIKRLMDLGCYRGLRHRKVFPCAASALIRTHVPKGPKRLAVKKGGK